MMYSRSTTSLPTSIKEFALAMAKPPKPPSWRDFEGKPKKEKDKSVNGVKNLRFTDLSTINVKLGSAEDGAHLGGHGPPASKKVKQHHKHHKPKSKAKIHRTRSHLTLESEELPRGDLTTSLAESQPNGLRTNPRASGSINAILYMNENNRKIEEWLEGVEDWEPLEDADFATGSGVDVEVPEEKWDDHLRPPINSSASTSDGSVDSGHKPLNHAILKSPHRNMLHTLPPKFRHARGTTKYDDSSSTSGSPPNILEASLNLIKPSRAKYQAKSQGKQSSQRNIKEARIKDYRAKKTESHSGKNQDGSRPFQVDPNIPGLVAPTATIHLPGAINTDVYHTNTLNTINGSNSVIKRFTELEISPKIKRANIIDNNNSMDVEEGALTTPIISIDSRSHKASV